MVTVGCGEGQIDSSSLVRHQMSLTLTGLLPGTVYYIYAYPSCFDSVVARHLTAATLYAAPDTLPCSIGFEDDNTDGWTLVNGNQNNRWMIGGAAGHPGRSLYITDNNASNNYSGQTSTVFATFALRFDSVGDYVYSFDWRCNGELHYDYLRAAIVPAYTVLTPGLLGGFDENEVPEGGIDLGNRHQLNMSTTWQNQSGTIHIATPGNYLWVFLWHNDLGGYHQTPAAVDNIIIEPSNGPPPTPHYIVSVAANNSDYGSVTGGGIYEYGDTAILTATPYEGYLFVRWSDGDTINQRNIIVTRDTALMAFFASEEGIDVVAEAKCAIYPNPTQGKATIATIEPIATASLTDMAGRSEEIKITTIGDGIYSIDLTAYPPATYLLTLTTIDGKHHTMKLLKQSATHGE